MVLPRIDQRDRRELVRSAELLRIDDPRTSVERAYEVLVDVYSPELAPRALFLLGQAYHDLGEVEQSVMLLELSAEAYASSGEGNKSASIFFRLVVDYQLLDDKGKSLQLLQRGVDVMGDQKAAADMLFDLGMEHRELGDMQVSAIFLNLSMEVDSSSISSQRAHQVLAEVYISLGEVELAAYSFLRVGEFQWEGNSPDLARESLERSLELVDSGMTAQRVHGVLAELHEAQENGDLAE